MTQKHKVSKGCWKSASRHARCTVATDLQFVKTVVSSKCSKVEYNKMRYACTFPKVRRPRLVHDPRLRKRKQSKAQELLTYETALVGEPGEAVGLGSVCTTTQVCWDRVSGVFLESASMILDLVQQDLCPGTSPKGQLNIEMYLSRSWKWQEREPPKSHWSSQK